MTAQQKQLVAKPFSAYLPIALTTLIMALVPGALVTSCMSIFFPLLAAEYGVQVSQVTIYMTVGGILMAFAGPFVGKLCATVDLRVIGASLVTLVALCYVALSFSPSLIVTVVAASIMFPGAMIGIGLFNPTLINRWFKDRAGALLGFSAAFTGIGGVIFLQVDQAIINAAGFRTAFLANAIIIAVLALPCVLFCIRSKPSDRGMLPYVNLKNETKEDTKGQEDALKKAASRNWSVDPAIALKSPAFWILCVAIALANATVMVAQFFPTYVNSLEAAGITAFVTGAGLASFTMAGQAICKFLLGAGSDLSPKKTVLVAGAVGIIAILFIWLGAQTALLPVGGLIFGMFYASPIVLMPLVAGAIFGTGDNYSVIWGRTMLPSGLLAAPAGVLWPWISETFGGFDAVFATGIGCIIVFVILVFSAMAIGGKLPHTKGVIPAAEKIKSENEAEAAAE
jgi:MFS transporter, OFA family, oxalate/formate antiporter